MKSTLQLPTTLQKSADSVVEDLLLLSQKLQAQQQVGKLTVANSVVKTALSQLRLLVSHTTDSRAEAILNRPDIHSLIPWLQQISAFTESETEKEFSSHLAKQVLAQAWPGDSAARVAQFCHLLERNYIVEEYPRVIKAELSLASELGWNEQSRIVFAGCGAMPLTAILYALRTNATVVGLDCDIEAVTRSLDLVHAMELCGLLPKGRVMIEHERAEEFNYRGFDAVVVASLIPNDVKHMIVQKTAQASKNEMALLVRSSHGLGELLYPHFEMVEKSGRSNGSRMSFTGQTQPKRYHHRRSTKVPKRLIEKDGDLLFATLLFTLEGLTRPRVKLDLDGGGSDIDSWQTGNKTSMNAKIIAKHGRPPGGFAASKLMDYL